MIAEKLLLVVVDVVVTGAGAAVMMKCCCHVTMWCTHINMTLERLENVVIM